MQPFGKVLIIVGILLVAIGVLTILAPKIPFIGKLPGDIYIKRDNFSFYFPLASSIIMSVILTIILNFILGRK